MKQRLKPPISSLIVHGAQYIGTIIFILCSALFVATNELKALILVECAHIFYRAFFWLVNFKDVTFKNNVKLFLRSVLPGAIAIVVLVVLKRLIADDSTTEDLIRFVTRIAVLCLVFPLAIPLTADDRAEEKIFISCRVLSHKQKSLHRIFTVLYRIFVILGFALLIFKKVDSGFTYETISIIGCIIWGARVVLREYFWYSCEIVSNHESDEEDYGEYAADESNSMALDNEKAIMVSEVEAIAKKIANRWSYVEEVLSSPPFDDAKISYKVSCEAISSKIMISIKYTVNGKLSGRNAEEWRSLAQSRLYQTSLKIKDEANKELGKRKLPKHYEISVGIGRIE